MIKAKLYDWRLKIATKTKTNIIRSARHPLKTSQRQRLQRHTDKVLLKGLDSQAHGVSFDVLVGVEKRKFAMNLERL